MNEVPGMTDAEVLRVLRARVHRLEGAIGAYFDSAQEIGTSVGRAWDRYDACIGQISDDETDEQVMERWRSISVFLQAYRDSLPRRRDALQALQDAVVEDFKTAVLTAEDMTDEQRAYWVALCDTEAKEEGQ